MTSRIPITERNCLQALVVPDAKKYQASVYLRLSCNELSLDSGPGKLARFRIISIGSEADRVLQSSRAGYVVASFDRSFYVQCDDGLVCAGTVSIGEGPLHILLAPGCDQLLAKVTVGLSVSITGSLSHQSGCAVTRKFSPGNDVQCMRYAGKVKAMSLTRDCVQISQDVLAHVVPLRQPGFGWVVANARWSKNGELADLAFEQSDTVDSNLRKQCLPAVLDLSRWLGVFLSRSVNYHQNASSSVKEDYIENNRQFASTDLQVPLHLSDLLGAGPGLTPAGDDLLAGVMLALYRLDRGNVAAFLWALLEPQVASRTNAISGAHLHLAAKGQCSASVLVLLESVFSTKNRTHSSCAQTMAQEIQSCANRIGASSGWDMLAGMSLVLRAL